MNEVMRLVSGPTNCIRYGNVQAAGSVLLLVEAATDTLLLGGAMTVSATPISGRLKKTAIAAGDETMVRDGRLVVAEERNAEVVRSASILEERHG